MYVMAIDQGTTGSTVFVFDQRLGVLGRAYAELPNYFPRPGWVEHDGEEIFRFTHDLMFQALAQAHLGFGDLTAIGLTNQRETTLCWSEDGRPLHRAIVWQDGRTADRCRELSGVVPDLKQRTGLLLNPYFSATKMAWLIEHLGLPATGYRLGTVDSFLVYRLSGGRAHLTDYTNASRTLLFNLKTLDWDQELLDLFGIARAVLPTLCPSSGRLAMTDPALTGGYAVPICGLVGDQQAALFGQGCVEPGEMKTTYGTGASILQYLGAKAVVSEEPILTTVAVDAAGGPAYALEGAVFSAGSVVQWLRDGLRVLGNSSECEALATSVEDNAGVYFVPAFNGLGAPYWNPEARAAILGLTRGADRRHLVRAALEGIAYQCKDLIDLFSGISGLPLRPMAVDGGAAVNDFLMQFQADLLGLPVRRPLLVDTTALGAALLAGLGSGLWSSFQELKPLLRTEREFRPAMTSERREALLRGWRWAVAAVDRRQ